MSCRINRSSPAAIAGGYSGWTTPYSYNPVRQVQLDIGWLSNGTCLRAGQLEELIDCEAGLIKLPREQLKDRCLQLNLTCPDVSVCCTPLLLRLVIIDNKTVLKQCVLSYEPADTEPVWWDAPNSNARRTLLNSEQAVPFGCHDLLRDVLLAYLPLHATRVHCWVQSCLCTCACGR